MSIAAFEADHRVVCPPAVSIDDASHKELHRIREVRQQQGISLRAAARRLDVSLGEAKVQEDPTTDMPLSLLHKWQHALEVPVSELLFDARLDLSPPVHDRARLVKVMKTAATIQESTAESGTRRLVEMLMEQLSEIMPELANIGPWQASGSQRGLDDLGRVADRRISVEALAAG